VRLRASAIQPRIISHCYTNEIFKGSGLEPGGSDLVPSTRIWHDNELRTIEHQLSCGFRKLPVSTNHGTDRNLPLNAFEGTDIKRFTGTAIHITADVIGAGLRFLQFVFAEVADKHFGIVEHDLTSLIEDGNCIPRQWLVYFQIGDSNTHFLVSRQGGEGLKETALLINGQGYPTSPTFGIERAESRANGPKLREYRQIRSECFGRATSLDALC